MTVTQYTCPDCGYKTKFAHHNTSLAELRKHRERERTMALHPAGKGILTEYVEPAGWKSFAGQHSSYWE